jgi:hypothetical protein
MVRVSPETGQAEQRRRRQRRRVPQPQGGQREHERLAEQGDDSRIAVQRGGRGLERRQGAEGARGGGEPGGNGEQAGPVRQPDGGEHQRDRPGQQRRGGAGHQDRGQHRRRRSDHEQGGRDVVGRPARGPGRCQDHLDHAGGQRAAHHPGEGHDAAGPGQDPAAGAVPADPLPQRPTRRERGVRPGSTGGREAAAWAVRVLAPGVRPAAVARRGIAGAKRCRPAGGGAAGASAVVTATSVRLSRRLSRGVSR